MPKLKEAAELDEQELEEAEYTGGDFASYNGEIPATGTMLLFRVTKMWWTYSQNEDPMLKVLCVAEDNDGDLEEFDGLPAWENMVLTAAAKFKWAPFCEKFGITVRDIRTKIIVASEDDNQGAPIEKIGTFVPGSDDAVFVGVVKKEKYQGKWQAHVSEWLDVDEPEEEKPAPRKGRAAANGRRTKPAAATGRGRRSREEPDEDEPEGDEDEAQEKPSSRSRTKAKPAARRGRRAQVGDDNESDEPPF